MTTSSAAAQPVTVFGGTGFLGRRIVRQLRDAGFAVRIASRHPDRGWSLFSDRDPGITSIVGDVNDEGGVAAALAGSFAVVNAVSLYVERGKDTFRSVHVEAAERVARVAAAAGVERLVHISGIGADPRSPSPYIRSRGEGKRRYCGRSRPQS
jgi:NADH dehydrogenase